MGGSNNPQYKAYIFSQLKDIAENPPENWRIYQKTNTMWIVEMTVNVKDLLVRMTVLSGAFPSMLLSTFPTNFLMFFRKRSWKSQKDFFIPTSVMFQAGFATKYLNLKISLCPFETAFKDLCFYSKIQTQKVL